MQIKPTITSQLCIDYYPICDINGTVNKDYKRRVIRLKGNIIKDVLISITKYSYQLLDYTENHNYVVTNQNRLPQYYSFNEDTIYV